MYRTSLLCLATFIFVFSPATAQHIDETDEPRSVDQTPTFDFIGDQYRIGVGLDTEFDIFGEAQFSLYEDYRSAWIGEGWLGRDGAGGLKFNHHWVFGGRTEETPDGPVYTSGRVAKLFIAGDQNQLDDRKLTVGGGYEHEDLFFSVYGMTALTDERRVNRAIELEDLLVEGQIDGRDFTRIDTLERVIDTFEAPYEWGAGVRVGKYFDGPLMRIRGGLDYEDGDFGASQTTASFSIDKYFRNTGHSLSLRTGYASKSGDFEIDSDDWRASLVYSYSFGQNYRSQHRYVEQGVTRASAQTQPQYEERLMATEVSLSDEATFAFDSAELRPAAAATLDELISAIREGGLVSRVRITGHTCDLGPADYNQGLSERRAASVTEYLLANGLSPADLVSGGRGETEPKYPNDSEYNRSRNRRVEISFVTEKETTQRIRVGAGEPATEIERVEIPVEAPWIRRALRNPVRHKRIVDYYRYQETSETVSEGEPVFANEAPMAVDDGFEVQIDSSDNMLDVLANDNDADGDELEIIDVTAASNGTVAISGQVLIYTPAAGFTGTDTFTYTVDDGFGGQASAQVTVMVSPINAAPTVEDVSASTQRGQPVDIDVLAAADDPDGDALSIESVGTPSNGTAEIVGDQVRYTPDNEFSGQDSFGFTVSDGRGGTATGTVTVNVVFENNPPVARPDTATGPAGVPITVDVLANDFDPDGDPLEVVSVGTITAAGAEITINPDNTVTFVISGTCNGENLFTYTISDPGGETAQSTVTVFRENNGTQSGTRCVSP